MSKTLEESNKRVARRYLEECWAKPDLRLVEELVAPNVSIYNSPFFPKGIQGVERTRQLIAAVRSLVPDLWIKVNDVIAEGDKVVLHWTSGGTQEGSWDAGNPPTGKPVEWSGVDIYKMADGKIVELVEVEDGLSLLYQIQALRTWKPD